MPIPHLFRTKKFWIPAVIGLIVVGGIVAKSQKKAPPEISTTEAKRQTLTQSVTETGTVVSSLKVEYGWQKTGAVTSILKKVGDQVRKGEVIASIEGTQEALALAQVKASLDAARAVLSQQIAGATNEERQKSNATVEQARASLAQAEAALTETKQSTNASVEQAENTLLTAENNLRLVQGGEDSQLVTDAYEDLIDTLKSTVATLSSKLGVADETLGVDNSSANDAFESLLGVLDVNTKFRAEVSYKEARTSVDSVENAVTILTKSTPHTVVDQKTESVEAAIEKTQKALLDTRALLDKTISGDDLTESELSSLKSDIDSARSSVNTAAASLTTSKQATDGARNSLSSYELAYDKAKTAVETAKQDAEIQVRKSEAAVAVQRAALLQTQAGHASVVAPPRSIDLASYEADVRRNQAIVADRAKEYEKTKLIAMVDGVISTLSVEVGEVVSANTPVLTILSPELTVEVDISEADVAKISPDDMAKVTLDALGEDTSFEAIVKHVDPAETEISGVVYYKTKLSFVNLPENHSIKPGMTANIEVFTDKAENVVVIPQRAILEKDGKKIVRVVTDQKTGSFEEKEVTTGLRGNDGLIEVASGLSEGDLVVTFLKEETK
ncbi:MAG: hypothetical protein A3J66_04505 [Candidatus Magasanikbacteria bacterium RIFCSPHIGHO2_02_FULL_47_14]|uniref:Multidrug resistance protein MdtA-like C-terminal permuted SH3 domain-containing protein n=1 Tax=Candidatus Magasanikbacteria bacterium RIFCSPHIGHO2_02_FULL_47_14 TaxID=1798680 RepID=A0A1F6M4M3_9BACT|nr:MAG: hypothetical protein A3J66_04505 [Candidatus Magasanikbacteria bacterium RIFCSPHIGHO2_02_FULL_47_14]